MPDTRLTRDCWFSPSADSKNQFSHQSICELHGVVPLKSPEDNDFSVLSSKTPGHLVVLEFSSDAGEDQGKMAEQVSQVLAQGNLPTILCVGNRVSVDQIVDWMRSGVFAYAEFDSPTNRIERLIEDAMDRVAAVSARYDRYLVLNEYWSHLTLPERSVLEMILEGIPNKTIATKLGVSQRTIEARRQKLYQKMNCKSLPGVVSSVFELKHLKAEFGDLKISSLVEENSKGNRLVLEDASRIAEPVAMERMVASFTPTSFSDVSNIS